MCTYMYTNRHVDVYMNLYMHAYIHTWKHLRFACFQNFFLKQGNLITLEVMKFCKYGN